MTANFVLPTLAAQRRADDDKNECRESIDLITQMIRVRKKNLSDGDLMPKSMRKTTWSRMAEIKGVKQGRTVKEVYVVQMRLADNLKEN